MLDKALGEKAGLEYFIKEKENYERTITEEEKKQIDEKIVELKKTLAIVDSLKNKKELTTKDIEMLLRMQKEI